MHQLQVTETKTVVSVVCDQCGGEAFIGEGSTPELAEVDATHKHDRYLRFQTDMEKKLKLHE